MQVYLDNAATTKIKDEVLKEMLPFFKEDYANPSAIYSIANNNKLVIDKAREQVADLINADSEEIYFTSGGSESDNWALKGIAESYQNKGKHIITSKIEHHAILNTCKFLETKGFKITYLDVDKDGKVNIKDLEKGIRTDTILISIMMANNEIGTIQDITRIGAIAHKHGILFHTDAVQSCGHIPIDVYKMNIDLLSASSHKFGGPKGIGFLYIKDGIKITPLIHGGMQENNLRAGTYNTPNIVGLGTASKLAKKNMSKNINYQKSLRDYLIDRILGEIPDVKLNGDKLDRLPNNANFSFKDINSDSLLMLLNKKGIYCSSGSACTSGDLSLSHVLSAINVEQDTANIRLTLSEDTTKEEIDYTIENLKEIITLLRLAH